MRPVRVACALLLLGSSAAAAGHKSHPAPHRRPAHHGVAPPHHKKAPPPRPPPADDEAVEEVEGVEAVDAAPATAASEGAAAIPTAAPPADDNRAKSPTEWLSRLHAAAVHLPLAWTTLLFLVEVAAWLGGQAFLQAPGGILHGLTLLSFAPAVLTGLLRYQYLPHADAASAAPALLHRNVMYACAACVATALLLRPLWRRTPRRAGRLLHLALLGISLGLATYGGHLGGALVYGDDFLLLPAFMSR